MEDGRYVQSLQKKLEPLFQAWTPGPEVFFTNDIPVEKMPSMSSVSTQESQQTESKCNPGSAGHPELCRRPCIYFAMGQCTNQGDCNFCHLPHNNRSSTLDKGQRQLIKEMSRHEFLSMLLRSLRGKAAEGRFELDAQDVLQLFKAQLAQLKPTTSKVSKARVMSLEKALTRMTFFSVASLTSRVNLDPGFVEKCKEKVHSLREKLA